jgi:hypothetical protein
VGDVYALIYCNIILRNLWATIWLDDCEGSSTLLNSNSNFEQVYYLPVEKKTLKDIRIEILTLDEKRVKFKDSTIPTKVVLHFRRLDKW